jgi:murein DD-endopeptidase MepM/ murein hydrolase activator NlpD
MKNNKFVSAVFTALTITSGAIGLNALSAVTPLTQSAQAAYYANCPFTVRIYQQTNVRPEPNTSKPPIASLPKGSTVWMSTFVNDGQSIYDEYARVWDSKWFKLRDQAGYVASAVVDGYPPTSPCPTPPPGGPVDMGGLQRLLFGNVSSTVTSPYGYANCTIPAWQKYYANCAHPALDIAGPVNTPIYTPVDGVVIGRNDTIGSVTLYNAKSDRTFFFVHMNRTDVTVNQQISKGKQVGIEGTKGEITGPHLHFEARPGKQLYLSGSVSQSVNPLDAVNQANR